MLNAGLEQRVEARTADLARANEEIQRFVQIISHDLRAPLVNIVGFTGELEDGVGSLRLLVDGPSTGSGADDPVLQEARAAATELLPEAIGYIRSSTEKMDRLISAILKLSREGRRAAESRADRPQGGRYGRCRAIQHQLSEADGKIDIDLDVPRSRPTVSRWSRSSAICSTTPSSIAQQDRPLRIEVRTRAIADDRVEIEIADNGRGIAERDRRACSICSGGPARQDQPGDGIGLAYVLAVLRNLGGDISLTSELGRGTSFRLTLPRALRAAEKIAA